MKRYVAARNMLRQRFQRAVDNYNHFASVQPGKKKVSIPTNTAALNKVSLFGENVESQISDNPQGAGSSQIFSMDKLEADMESLSFENAAYETICKVTVANMVTFDIEKFKMHRQRSYYGLIQKIARQGLEGLGDVNDHFERIMKIMK